AGASGRAGRRDLGRGAGLSDRGRRPPGGHPQGRRRRSRHQDPDPGRRGQRTRARPPGVGGAETGRRLHRPQAARHHRSRRTDRGRDPGSGIGSWSLYAAPAGPCGLNVLPWGGRPLEPTRGRAHLKPMFIQTEATPNPNALKFLPGREVAPHEALEYRSIDEAAASPLAEALFELEGVEGVFFGADYVSVTRGAQGPGWSEMKAPILSVIMDHFVSGAPLVRAVEAAAEAAAEDNEIVAE